MRRREKYGYYVNYIIGIVFMWMLASIIASITMTMLSNCDKNYPISYVLHTSLFCEIKTVQQYREE